MIKKKLILFLGFLILAQILPAQSFIETAQQFTGVSLGSIAFADVNGDGYQDVLITGQNNSNERIAELYTNDGQGNFTEMTGTPFDGVWLSSIAFADVNGNGNQDVLITGRNSSNEQIAKLYTNDGQGNFTEKTDNPFDGVWLNSIAFADVNGDTHQDVLITGQNNSNERIAKLYTNDGQGNFTEMPGTPFDGVWLSSIAFADVNGDTHQDVLITGENSSNERIAKLYTNDGQGNFTEMTETPFDGVTEGSIAFADVNGDGHQDVLINGRKGSERIVKLYTNDGQGDFTEIPSTPFDEVASSSIAFADVNGDGHQDVLITGQKGSGEIIAKLYTNDGQGSFTEITDTPFDGVHEGSVAFADVNGDTHQDVLITGRIVNTRFTKLYTNDGMTSSTDELFIGQDINITPYPNPTKSNILNVSFDSVNNGFTNIKVYTLDGRMLAQQKEFTVVGQQTIPIDITFLSPGSYLIQMDTGKRKGFAMFIVQ